MDVPSKTWRGCAVLSPGLSARRQDVLSLYLDAGYPTTLILSLATPEGGLDDRLEAALSITFRNLVKVLPELLNLKKSGDKDDTYAIMHVPLDAIEVKRRCIALEMGTPFSQLIDLDVYDGSGTRISRALLGLTPRPCLACGQRAADCIRHRHLTPAEIPGRLHELLAHLRD
ncbi:citrate lyase holo-[acyl-carrier protein] synthase [Geobacter sulfurreducens]|uniref:citrate lyase holo-[acyl-carrier protein] synthase n=1 Tax=Geobacter sulfurreducens (strain ATCC 51573 / DSM 12127 / PCA) TaxID=243231 RepID=Q74F02_GEOSL|nr:citrate lyase holo-[acyl-carrier protein] synthase [Geobacter sulfurreducens]AAR34137.1 apo-citrate lyase 2'-(5''-triphosphoribosyl)-3'-dephospho-coenzyme A transferase [Geobacter sulfurreducens PCA]ADI83650.2 apo-citrate lyase 2'-(5''-triphosphoribosyl)-3'-dephospho-coenzyme A transferase [Geobacter sulfurreducens KN400]AJY70550.1 apo-citrate lyase phosphoribosyl-dephospho-CoA transferase [Geobacter sulfurreducens]UAC04871.1 citrate lyase holo-[acyl-carrier protein] synthase [Geobacter sulf